MDCAEPPELRRAAATLLRALDACAARRLPQHADGRAMGLCHLALVAVTARVAARCEADDELSSLWVSRRETIFLMISLNIYRFDICLSIYLRLSISIDRSIYIHLSLARSLSLDIS